ncbi:MAG: HPr family phosphocarrier protein [Deltaproteobacteria bacterium]|nr:MAG: HPr family phosphocarrier protein [Deltaproteobacteria bacterium]
MIVEETFEIVNEKGMHARAAGKVVALAKQFESEIYLIKDGNAVDAKSILEMMTLAAAKGSKVTVRAEGRDAQTAVAAIGAVIEDKFGEEA